MRPAEAGTGLSPYIAGAEVGQLVDNGGRHDTMLSQM